jgi:aquaporin Z
VLHWPEYLMEAAALGTFMISACVFGVLLGHPASAVHQAIESDVLRRIITGIAMGLTAIAIFCSPWGKRSGAHMNPAVTIAFWSLGKMAGRDALFYIAAQFAGAAAGVLLASVAIGVPLTHTAVNYVATAPGPGGPWVAFSAEFVISLGMLLTVLVVSNSRAYSRYTPFVAGTLVAIYISVEAPLSGMSMNPARTLGSAVFSGDFAAIWVYFTAPVAAMLLAAAIYRAGSHEVFCAKFHHHNDQPCIFRCNFAALGGKTYSPQRLRGTQTQRQ